MRSGVSANEVVGHHLHKLVQVLVQTHLFPFCFCFFFFFFGYKVWFLLLGVGRELSHYL